MRLRNDLLILSRALASVSVNSARPGAKLRANVYLQTRVIVSDRRDAFRLNIIVFINLVVD